MGDLSIQRQGEEVVIRLNIQDLDKTFLDKIRELVFWEYALRKAGFSSAEIQQVFEESRQIEGPSETAAKGLSDAEIKSWTDAIEQRWWDANADQMLEGVSR